MKNQNLYEITLNSKSIDSAEYWDGMEFRKANPGEIRFDSKEEAEREFPAAVAWAKANSSDWINAEFHIVLTEMVYDEETEEFEDEENELLSESFTPENEEEE
jgi:hypothetical protein